MKRDHYIQRKEAETFKKLHAFQLFKESGIDIINQSFPHFKDFIIKNQGKDYAELERELFIELRSIKEIVH